MIILPFFFHTTTRSSRPVTPDFWATLMVNGQLVKLNEKIETICFKGETLCFEINGNKFDVDVPPVIKSETLVLHDDPKVVFNFEPWVSRE